MNTSSQIKTVAPLSLVQPAPRWKRLIPRASGLGAWVLLVAFLAGCIPSLNPLYTKETLVFDPALVGTWSEKPDDKETWTFKKDGDKVYRAIITSEDKPDAEFVVHLLKLKDQLWLDFFPSEKTWEENKQNDFFKGHFVAAHTFYRVDEIGPKLVMASLSPDWIKDLVVTHPEAIAHHKMLDDSGNISYVVFTASTDALQKFCTKYAQTKEAFGEASKLVKRP